MKRIRLAACILMIIFMLSGCQQEATLSPAETVDAFMKALSTLDEQAMENLYVAEKPLKDMMETEADQKVVQCIFSKLQWEIGEERIEDDLARVTVRITAAPYDEMVLAYQTHVEENLESYRANYQDLGEEEYQKAILEDRLDFYRSYGNTVTTTIEMDLVYQEEHWVVSHCEGFSDALLGVQP